MFKQIAMFSLFLSTPLLGESISGDYGVTGFNPHTLEPYRGTAVIKEKGDVVDITWHLKPKGPVYAGTGIRKGNTIAVTFKNPSESTDTGVVLYTIQDENALAGKWVYLGRDKKGSETLIRNDVH